MNAGNMTKLESIKDFLKNYDGPEMKIMEVCGSHTGVISKSGIPGLLSEKLHLLSGPGCPVCVTPSSYIDRLIALSLHEKTTVCTFGDLLRVPGSSESLAEAKGRGGRVVMLYSPFDVLEMALKQPEMQFVFAAIGFETTAPVYALLAERIEQEQIANIRLLTSIRTMPEVLHALLESGAGIDGFLAPGHVSVVTGSKAFIPLAEEFGIPFGVAGFQPEQILEALAGIVKAKGQGRVMNFYPSVVTEEGNIQAQALIRRCFRKEDAIWRGLGNIPRSGLYLRKEPVAEEGAPSFIYLDAGSRELSEDKIRNKACRCGEVLTGRIRPTECPLFGKACHPLSPQGACMVSEEGNCRTWYAGGRTR